MKDEYKLLGLFCIMKTFGHENILYTLWMVNEENADLLDMYEACTTVSF